MHIGEKFTNKKGQEFEIIDWHNCNNVDVKFADGTIKKGCKYNNLKHGICKYPDYKMHVGEKYINKQNMKYTIIDWKNSNDVTVRFSDGAVKKNCRYGNVKRGICPHPDKDKRKIHAGKVFINTQGFKYWITSWENSNNITIKFEDGKTKEKCKYADIQNGSVRHPDFENKRCKRTNLLKLRRYI